MDTTALQDLGLSPTEITVFLTLLELGECKAGRLIQRSGLQSSSAYHGLHGLIEKGLASYMKKSQVKHYRAANPETVLDFVDDKKREFLKMLPELKARQVQTEAGTVEFFRSYRGIKTIFSELFDGAKKGDVCRSFAIEDPDEYERARKRVYRGVKQLAKEKGVQLKGVFHTKIRYQPKKSTSIEKRYVDFPIPPNTLIINDKVAILTWSDEPSGILIHSKDIAEKYTEFFDHIWESGSQ